MQAAAKDLTSFSAPLILARVFRAAASIVRPEKKVRSIRRSISESGETDNHPTHASIIQRPLSVAPADSRNRSAKTHCSLLCLWICLAILALSKFCHCNCPADYTVALLMAETI